MSLLAVDPAADAERRRGLRRMRTLAVSLLLFAAVVYVATLDQDGFLGFVNAGAEASMVGAIADWFAVTALFKHPLGLPIPHTALIPKRKDELGRGLEEFVGENFLQEEIIRERVAAATISLRVGRWLTEPANARRVVDEVADVAAIALGKVRDEHIEELVDDVLVPRFREEPIAPLLGGLLERGGARRPAPRPGRPGPRRAAPLAAREPRDRRRGARRAGAVVGAGPAQRARSPPGSTSRWCAGSSDIRDDPHHHARQALDSMLAQLAARPAARPGDPGARRAAQGAAARPPAGDRVRRSRCGTRCAGRSPTSLADPEGAVRAAAGAGGARRSPSGWPPTRRCAPASTRWPPTLAVFAVERYGAELTAVITHTIERWDGKEAAARIELHVGRDLQFIRINGTIVGGLVGVLIHTVAGSSTVTRGCSAGRWTREPDDVPIRTSRSGSVSSSSSPTWSRPARRPSR